MSKSNPRIIIELDKSVSNKDSALVSVKVENIENDTDMLYLAHAIMDHDGIRRAMAMATMRIMVGATKSVVETEEDIEDFVNQMMKEND